MLQGLEELKARMARRAEKRRVWEASRLAPGSQGWRPQPGSEVEFVYGGRTRAGVVLRSEEPWFFLNDAEYAAPRSYRLDRVEAWIRPAGAHGCADLP